MIVAFVPIFVWGYFKRKCYCNRGENLGSRHRWERMGEREVRGDIMTKLRG